MKFFVVAASALFISASAFSADTENAKETEFFAGVVLLQQQTALSAGEKAAKFRELEAMTGISAAEAQLILAKQREKPDVWQKKYAAVMSLLNETNQAILKNDSARTAAADTGKKAPDHRLPKRSSAQKSKR